MGIIRNYGIFWNRENVDWGRPGHSGTLLGKRSAQTSQVDFRTQAGVYVLYEGDSIPTQRVTYIGQAGIGSNNLFLRLRSHLNDHLWNRWSRFSWFGVYHVGKGGTLVHAKSSKGVHSNVQTIMNELEGVLAVSLEPLLNKRGPNWKDVEQYYQLDEDMDYEEERLEEIREGVETSVKLLRKK